MNVKKRKKLAVCFIVVGLIITLIFNFVNTDDYSSGILCGMGTSLIAIGILQLVRIRRLSRNPEKLADYEAANQDERVRYIANKARALVFLLSVYAQLAVGLIAQFVFHQRLLCTVMSCFVCLECLLFVAVYWYYSKKY